MGIVLVVFSEFMGVKTNVQTELTTILRGLELAVDMGYNKVWIEIDAINRGNYCSNLCLCRHLTSIISTIAATTISAVWTMHDLLPQRLQEEFSNCSHHAQPGMMGNGGDVQKVNYNRWSRFHHSTVN
ncbi:UNVERIFIED_CONTAM: hypothetical protein Sradi_5684000 [Sesamum radiatum]|uniref:RNase H type-1 domain-containing protein n=1 Tax=Sesamum radiatum TaxID=300843 RepID=A0AAW2L364_SESRA